MKIRGALVAGVVIAIVVLVSLSPLTRVARAPPPAPHTTFGQAFTAGGSPLPMGTPIRTFIDGTDYSNLTSVYDGAGSFYVDTLGNWEAPPTSTIKEGGGIGDAIMFASGELDDAAPGGVFRETGSWSTGGFVNQNLNLAATQPALLKIQTLVPRPMDALNQYVYLCNPTSGSVDASTYYLEQNDPGQYNGPSNALSGTMRPGGRLYVELPSPSWLTETGDALKLVWNNPGGVGAPNGGADLPVDRVEFNATSAGTLFWEPGNTMMTDAPAPGVGQEIRRTDACADTNAGSDFTIVPETGRLAPPTVSVSYPDGGERLTGGASHTIFWNLTDADPDGVLLVNVSYTLDGNTYISIASGLSMTDPSSTSWTLPVVDSTTARVLVCALDRTDLLGCDRSGAPFTIDSTRPLVQSTDPPDGGTNVLLDKVVTVTFNEPMQPAPRDVSFVPAVGGITYTWPTPSTVEVRHALFAGCQAYTMNIGGVFLDASRPGNVLLPVSRTFTTICAPTLVLGAPDGGEVLTGGSPFAITWQMSDEQANPQLTTWINLSTNGGASFATPIDGPTLRAEGPISYPWTVNTLDIITARIQVCVMDDGGLVTCASSASDFEIDSTPPTIISVSPADGTRDVMPDDLIVITFSEPMNRASALVTVTPDPGGLVPAWNAGNTTLTLQHNPFLSGPVIVTVTAARDDSAPGNLLVAGPVPNPWTFDLNSAPSATLVSPVGGECWSGGSTHDIRWTMSDSESAPDALVVYVNVTIGGGGGPISGRLTGLTGSPSFPWNVPVVNDLDVYIEVTVIDTRGLKTTVTSGRFEIDATAPTLTSTPANNAIGVGLMQPITLRFSEPMNQAATEAAITLTPALANPVFSWAGNDLTIGHDGFAAATAYRVDIGTGARDACDPGNPTGATTIQFTTASNTNPVADFTAPTQTETWNPGETKRISWTMTDTDETPTAQLRVWLNYTSGSDSGTLVSGQLGTLTYDWAVPAGLAGRSVTFHLDVLDTQGGKGSQDSVAVQVASTQGAGIDLIVLAGLGILIAAIIAGLLFFLLAKRRKKEEPPKKGAKPPAKPAAKAPPKAPGKPAAQPPSKAAAPKPPVSSAPAAAPRPAPAPKPAPAPSPPAVAPAAAPAEPAAEEVVEEVVEEEPAAEEGTKQCPGCGSIVDGDEAVCPVCDHRF